ncbi:SRPBCC family protein [Roseibium sp. SCPC15]|uniref:SRPBCC family protein n=1 Tax=Roseibium sp. SCP15 TaxID=3141376 RepID=UPI00333D2323
MAEIAVSQVVRVPLADLWQSWDRFDEIFRFNPVINQSPLLPGSAKSGIGAERHCKHVDGKTYLKERIIGYWPEEHLVIDIFDANIPLKKAVVTLDFMALSAVESLVTMRIRFTPKFGLIGWFMTPLIRMQFRKGLTDLLVANADFVENGVEIHPKAAA